MMVTGIAPSQDRSTLSIQILLLGSSRMTTSDWILCLFKKGRSLESTLHAFEGYYHNTEFDYLS